VVTCLDVSEVQTELRNELLSDYERSAIPPTNTVTTTNGSQGEYVFEPLRVEVGLNFYRIIDVNVVTSSVDLLVWLRIAWYDKRLVWDPTEYGGLDRIGFFIAEGSGFGEVSEIWTPDISLWNAQEPVSTSFDSGMAIVKSDGYVYWSRPGHLRASCKFQGLERFPFDDLSCLLELGSWSYSSQFISLGLLGGTGFTLGGSKSSGESFQEFTLKNVSAEIYEYPPYPADPSPWPVLLYTVVFDRSWQPYIRGFLLSQMIFNIIGFAAFWLPISSGERVGLTITSMLAAVASDLVVVDQLPAAPELTWMQRFSMMSQAFATYTVLEAVVVSYFFFLTSETLVPAYFRCLFNMVGKKKTSSPRYQSNGDADDATDAEEVQHNDRWRRWGEGIDSFSRVVLPVAYAICVSIFLTDVN